MISNMKLGENWTARGHRRSLRTDRRQGSKKFLIMMIESKLEAERSESVLGSMPELAEIVAASFRVSGHGRRALLVPARCR